MPLEIYWKLSTAAAVDARRGEWHAEDRPWTPGSDARSRALQINRYDYLAQVARAAELTGFDGIFVPDDPDGEEPWIVTGSLIRETRRLKIVTEVAPGSASAVYQAKMAASLQRFSGDRQAWALNLSRPAEVRKREGDFADDADIVPRAEELLTLAKGIWGPGPFDQDGRFSVVEKGGLAGLVANATLPEVWIDGASEAATALAVRQSNVLLLPPLPIGEVNGAIAAIRARPVDRPLRIAAQIDLFARADDADLAAEQARLAPARNRLSGTYDDVAAALSELSTAGLDIAVFSAGDQIREVHIAGEQIVSRLRAGRTTSSLAV
jgi:alkanesulfonate monooxygenase